MEKYPLAKRIRISRRGRQKWNLFFYEDNPTFFNILDETIGFRGIQQLTNNSYLPIIPF